jgi:hypothetical protein
MVAGHGPDGNPPAPELCNRRKNPGELDRANQTFARLGASPANTLMTKSQLKHLERGDDLPSGGWAPELWLTKP